MGIKKGPKRIA